MSIYDTDKALNSVENRIKKANYCKENKKLFFDFENYLFANGLSSLSFSEWGAFIVNYDQIPPVSDKYFILGQYPAYS